MTDSTTGTEPTRGHDPYAPLRCDDFRRYLMAGMLLTIGGQMQGVAVGWELYRRTGSAMPLGLVGLVQFVPVLLLALPAGHAADRYSRRSLLLVSLSLLLAASAGLAVLSMSRGPVVLIYLCLFLGGIVAGVEPTGAVVDPAAARPQGAFARRGDLEHQRLADRGGARARAGGRLDRPEQPDEPSRRAGRYTSRKLGLCR